LRHGWKYCFPPAKIGEELRGKHEAARECSENDILTPEIGAMYGPNNTSEAAQAERIVDRPPSNALVLADSSEGSAQKQTTVTRIMMKTKWHWAQAVR
jgi:hypothetical protein